MSDEGAVSDDAVLRLVGVSKSYGAVSALQDVSLEVKRGEIVGLVGDNGAGKSTTVKIIAGAIRADAGDVIFDGARRSWSSPHDARAAGIETVYQDMGLVSHLSVSGNIFLGRELRRGGVLGRFGFYDSRAMQLKAAEVIAGLKVRIPRGEYPVSDLSGGQRQAVAIAKSVTWARKLLLMDEPTNHLGVQGSNEVLDLMRRVSDLGVGVVFISHTIPYVLKVAHRIVVLWQGRVTSVMGSADATVESVVAEITGASAVA